MNPTQHSWEQFCKTGLVSDYLSYRKTAQMNRGDPGPVYEEEHHEDHHRGNCDPPAEYR